MTPNPYPKGSEWRKWDLHIHTPKSINQEYGGDTPEVWEKFITDLEALPEEYKVIGINDYIFIDGYKKVLEYKVSGRLKNIDLILPVVELRIDKFASLGDEAWKKVNLHVIFSDQQPPEVIEAQFLSAIQHSIKISPDVEGVTFQGVATRETLMQIGKQIKESSSVPINDSDLKVGFSNINFSLDAVLDCVYGYFKGSALTAVGKSEWDTMRWTGSPAEKKNVINRADFSFISLEKPEDYNKHIEALQKQKVKDILLDCSDAHAFSTSSNKDRIGNSFTWLKADPTFEGLKQVANDKDRIYVGERPPLLKRVEDNKTKFISSLKIEKIDTSLGEKWFENFELPLNPSMVAIIGNKGSGKSAIADTLGLLGNTPNFEYFSFLNKAKFKSKKPQNKAASFKGTITWEDGNTDENTLDQDPTDGNIEKVKYIPQGFLERLCNRNQEDADMFEPELRKVIFSHISESERLGQSSLNEIIEYRTEITNSTINQIKEEVVVTNRAIVALEEKKSPNYLNSLEQKIKEKTAELVAHEAIKPKEVTAPTDENIVKQNKDVTDAIEKSRKELETVEFTVAKKQNDLIAMRKELEEIQKTGQAVKALEEQVKKFEGESVEFFKKHNLKIEEIVSVKIDKTKLYDLYNDKENKVKAVELELGKPKESGLLQRRDELTESLKSLQNGLTEQSKNYQRYIDELANWEKRKIQIIGTADKIDTIAYLSAQKQYVTAQLQDDLDKQYIKRIEAVRKLYKAKDEIIKLYKSLFKPISDFISENGQSLGDEYSIKLDVDYRIDGFIEKFFDHISQGAKGSFIGNPKGVETLRGILELHDLGTEDGAINFVEDILDHLKFDYREEEKPAREIEKQLKKGYSVMDFYTFLFDLDYLLPEYKLKLGQKSVSELSPGERGALLLMFYLSLDQETIPLVIDQPEENLDNQSIFKILVQFIKNAKGKRQIIIVTHNPNLAVASNAEQIVHVSIDKKDGNKVNYITGALENEAINSSVIDILEGTYPALTTRTNTYKIIKRN